MPKNYYDMIVYIETNCHNMVFKVWLSQNQICDFDGAHTEKTNNFTDFVFSSKFDQMETQILNVKNKNKRGLSAGQAVFSKPFE